MRTVLRLSPGGSGSLIWGLGSWGSSGSSAKGTGGAGGCAAGRGPFDRPPRARPARPLVIGPPPTRASRRARSGHSRSGRWISTPPSPVRTRISGRGGISRRKRSTTSATSWCTASRSLSWISMSTSKVGGALRSSTVFWVPRRRASSSESVTAWMPPTRSESVGFCSRLSSVLPCAVATSCTPRSAMVRAASASAVVPISSMTMTCGMWFSTASIITACCWSGDGTCMRRARPMPGCGMSPSPAISFEVSTITTRLPSSSASDAGRLAQQGRLADARAGRAAGSTPPPR